MTLPVEDFSADPVESFDTGARRSDATGKGRFDLLPFLGLQRLARRFEAGGAVYGDRNWENGQPQSRVLSSALRHIYQYLAGMEDEDHLGAAAWNVIVARDQDCRAGVLPDSVMDTGPKSPQVGSG